MVNILIAFILLIIFTYFFGFIFLIIEVNRELKFRLLKNNREYRNLKKQTEHLEKEIEFNKTLLKTYSEGLEAFTKKK